jgi:hypothetical protein
VEPLGTNPLLGLPDGTFKITSVEVPVSQCNGVLTFTLRTRSERPVKIQSDLVLLNVSDGEFETEPVTNATTEEFLITNSEKVCMTVQCRVDPVSLGLPRIGRVILTVTVREGAEVSNMDFSDGKTCDDLLEFLDDVSSSCNGSTTDGDCGYRNTGCGSAPWTLDANVTEGEEEEQQEQDESTTLVDLQTSLSADSCEFEECIPCSKTSGFTVSSSLQPTIGLSTKQDRKRRSFKAGIDRSKDYTVSDALMPWSINLFFTFTFI